LSLWVIGSPSVHPSETWGRSVHMTLVVSGVVLIFCNLSTGRYALRCTGGIVLWATFAPPDHHSHEYLSSYPGILWITMSHISVRDTSSSPCISSRTKIAKIRTTSPIKSGHSKSLPLTMVSVIFPPLCHRSTGRCARGGVMLGHPLSTSSRSIPRQWCGCRLGRQGNDWWRRVIGLGYVR